MYLHCHSYQFLHKLHHLYKQPDVFSAYFITYQVPVPPPVAAFCVRTVGCRPNHRTTDHPSQLATATLVQ
jgi:hypothetical protein